MVPVYDDILLHFTLHIALDIEKERALALTDQLNASKSFKLLCKVFKYYISATMIVALDDELHTLSGFDDTVVSTHCPRKVEALPTSAVYC
ncbi:hypothetical protein ALQ05_200303 [Pseudomonas amygdali pv. mori]|uniref:Uncharacterized protein n=1 Tax=Pseudomonas amygdali pv. mori TaxID=34065 RepID=A0A3M4LJ54_PSEA0|nr:hypothetical protein ALQ05_200303 [Pseudomonas amygdali pv. mori]